MKVELDKTALFALASDTRVDLLRALQPMRRTVTQLADALGIDKAAVHRHLQKLVEGGFVVRYEDHGFVYYGLSWKARDLLSPNENTKVVVVLGSAWGFLLGAVMAFIAALTGALVPRGGGSTDYTLGADPLQRAAPAADATGILLLIAGIVWLSVTVILLYRGWRSLERPVQPGPQAEDRATPPEPNP